MQQRDVSTMNIRRWSQDELSETLKLFCPASRSQQDAAIRKNLRLPELHGDGEVPEVREALTQRRPRTQFVVSAESDMRLDKCVLPWIKPLPDRLNDGSLLWR
jgi:hypothetical protein